jgi:N-acetylmuramoyl-L-alanine amidase
MSSNRLSWQQIVSAHLGSVALSFNALRLIMGFIVTVLLLGLCGAVAAETASPTLPDVIAARVTTTPQRARLILDLSGQTKFAIVSLDNPPRIAVDVAAGALKFATPPLPAGTGIVTSYAVELAEPGRARTTLTLDGPVQVQQAYTLDAFDTEPARLVVDLIPDTVENFSKRVAPPLADNSTPPGGTNAAPAPSASAPVATAAPADNAAATPTAAPAKPKPLIVLDPGHGGIDNGATAPNGVHEKAIVLAFALKLQALLVKSGRFDVALTRSDDEYLTLEQRVALARTNKADLFISLHADTFGQPQIRGTSIYTRDEQATDVLDKVLAENENKFDVVSGFAVPKMTPATVNVLLDLMRRQMRKQSFMAAQSIIHTLQPSIELRRFPVRAADFFVLQAPDVPSMLIELGFMSNNDDIAHLMNPQWQDRVADALSRGIAGYFDGAAAP